LEEHISDYHIDQVLKAKFENSRVIGIREVTQGQACTCEIAVKDLDPNAPICITACDNGVVYDEDKYEQLLNDFNGVDCIVWSFRNNPTSVNNPHMYAWLDVDENDYIKSVSVKKCPYNNPLERHAIIGTMFFRKASYFTKGLQIIYEKNIRTNGEFYVDDLLNPLIQEGLKIKVFESDFYVCWGTPDDYRTFLYWSTYFALDKKINHTSMLTIFNAKYGANNTFIDVTDKVKSLLEQRDGKLIVSNHYFGDPISGVVKTLVVESSMGTLSIAESDILTNNGKIYIEIDPTLITRARDVIQLYNPNTGRESTWIQSIGDPINIVFYSNCQNLGIAYFLRKYYAANGIRVNIDTSMQNYWMLASKSPLDETLLKNADIFIYQPIADVHGIYSTSNNIKNNIVSYLKKDCIKIAFPYIYNSAFWCLLTPSLGDALTGGGRENDVNKYVNTEPIRKLKEQGFSLQEVLEKFKNNAIDFEYEFRFNDNLRILQEKEKKCDVIVSDFIKENAGKIRLFYNQGHPTTPVFVHCANQVLNILDKNAPRFSYNYPEQNFVGNWCLPHTTYDNNFWKFKYSIGIDNEYYVPHITKIYELI
jgi:hypothetical protein